MAFPGTATAIAAGKVKNISQPKEAPDSSASLRSSMKEVESNFFVPTDSAEHKLIDMDPDLTFICKAFRVDDRTRLWMSAFDARNLEEFAMMTDSDLSEMVLTAARYGRPLPPMQIRKLDVLVVWARELLEEAAVAEENCRSLMEYESLPSKEAAKGAVGPEEQIFGQGSFCDTKAKMSDMKCYLIPSNWQDRFNEDFPKLKIRLKERGDTTTDSNWTMRFLSFRWIFCGYSK